MNSITSISQKMGTPLFLFSVDTFRKNYQRLQHLLPQVKHHYALKALPHISCIEVIQELNGYLDLATVGEMQLVEQVNPTFLKNAIVTHPIKSHSDLQIYAEKGIKTLVIDNLDELQKLIPFRHNFQLLFRIAFSNDIARCDLSKNLEHKWMKFQSSCKKQSNGKYQY